MKFFRRLRRSAACCYPVRVVTMDTQTALFSLPAVGMPGKTSTPNGAPSNLPLERYSPRDQPLKPRTIPVHISEIPEPKQRKQRKTPAPAPQQPAPTHMRPVPAHMTSVFQPTTRHEEQPCSADCLVCAFAKPELRRRHKTASREDDAKFLPRH